MERIGKVSSTLFRVKNVVVDAVHSRVGIICQSQLIDGSLFRCEKQLMVVYLVTVSVNVNRVRKNSEVSGERIEQMENELVSDRISVVRVINGSTVKNLINLVPY